MLRARVVAVILLALVPAHLGVSAARADEPVPSNPSPSPTPTPIVATPSPSPTATPSGASPGPAEEAPPDAPPTPAPSSSPTPGVPGDPTPAGQEASELDVSLTAEPVALEVGATTELRAEVANTGQADVAEVGLDIEVPAELEVVEISPEGVIDLPVDSDGGIRVSFELGTITPGERREALVVARAHRATVAGGASVVATAFTGDVSSSASATVAITAPPVLALGVTTTSRELVVQVGDTVHYSIEVSNEGDEALRNVVIVDFVPREVRVIVPTLLEGQPKQVDSVVYGRFLAEESIVWVISSLGPGESLELPWEARAAAPRDLTASNRVTGKARDVTKLAATNTTYLGVAAEGPTRNPHFTPIVKKRVVTVPAPALAGRAAVLPVTGATPRGLVLVALLMIGSGLVILGCSGSRPTARRRAVTGALVLSLALGGCVSDDPEPQAKDRVKGARIEGDGQGGPDEGNEGSGDEGPGEDQGGAGDQNQDQGGAGDQNQDQGGAGDQNQDQGGAGDQNQDQGGAGADGGAQDPGAGGSGRDAGAPDGANQDPGVGTVRRVVTVTRDLSDLPVDALASFETSRDAGYTWDGASVSGLRRGGGHSGNQPARLRTEIGRGQDGIQVTVELTNPSARRRLRVQGRLSHAVRGPNGAVARFTSPPLDLVLDPGGSTRATFSYLLPSGRYSAAASFQT